MNPKSVICKGEMEKENGNFIFNTVEMCLEYENRNYFDESGNEVIGNIFAIF